MLDVLWFAGLITIGLVSCSISAAAWNTDNELSRFSAFLLGGIFCFISALIVSADFTVIPAYSWLLSAVPDQNSSMHQLTVLLLTSVGCAAFVIGLSLSPLAIVKEKNSEIPSGFHTHSQATP